MRMTEQPGYIGMTGQREVARNKPRFSLIALKLIQPLGKRAQAGTENRRTPSVLRPVCGSAHVHTTQCRPFPSLARGERLWLVQGDHGSQSNDFEK